MLNLRTDSSSSDELRRPKTTVVDNAPAGAAVTQRQLQFSAQPRSAADAAASRDVSTHPPNLSLSSSSSRTSNNSNRMPDRRLRAMSTGDYDPLHRALTFRDRKANATVSPAAQGLRYHSSDMETKRMMGLKDRDDRMRMMMRGGEWRRQDQQESDPVHDDDDHDHDDDDVLQELQLRMGFVAVDDHRALAAGATSYKHSSSPGYDVNRHLYEEDYSDEDDDDEDQHYHAGNYMVDTPELAAFLGLTIPHQQQQPPLAFPPPMFPKAASFSGHQQQRYSHSSHRQQQSQPMFLRGMVPCSPPVPIPRKPMRRRRNSVTGSLLTTSNNNNNASHLRDGAGGDDDDMSNYYSRTQCEARLWDEDWHFKLSLEARESFEASNTSSTSFSNHSASKSKGVWKPQSTVSMASTADTFRDEDESTGDSEDDEQVFDMDDL